MAESTTHHAAAQNGEHTKAVGTGLKKKVGPLPLWAWGAMLGVVAYFVYARASASKTSTGSASQLTDTGDTASTLDPTSTDPNTGLTYGQEESAAEDAMAADGSDGLGGGGTGDSGATGSTGADTEDLGGEISDVTGLLSGIAGLEQTFQSLTGSSSGTSAATTPVPQATAMPDIFPANSPAAVARTSGKGATVKAHEGKATPAQHAARHNATKPAVKHAGDAAGGFFAGLGHTTEKAAAGATHAATRTKATPAKKTTAAPSRSSTKKRK